MNMKELTKDLSDLGCHEFINEAILLYLAVTSRKMSRKIPVILSGESGSGKSVLLNRILDLLPQDDIMAVSFLTKAALLRSQDLSGRVVLLTEHIEDRTLSSAFRQLVSEGQVYYKLVLQGEVQTLTLRGPVVLLESVVDASEIDFQNRNRAFVVTVSPSSDDLRKRFERIKLKSTLGWHHRMEHCTNVTNRHREFQAGIPELEVVIPFAEHIGFFGSQPYAQRLLENILNLISATALLDHEKRQKHKLPDGRDYIEATIDDYEDMHNLVGSLNLDTGTDLMPERSAELFAALRLCRDFESPACFTRHTIAEKIPQWTYKRVRRWIGNLVDNDLVLCRTGQKGRKEYSFTSDGENLKPESIFKNCLDSLSEPNKLRTEVSLAEVARKQRQAEVEDIKWDKPRLGLVAPESDKEV